MVSLGRLFGGDKEKLAYKHDLVCSTMEGESRQPESPEQEYIQMMAKVGYLTVDEHVIRWLFDHPQFHALIAALAPVNRTTVLTKQQAEINRIDLEILITMMKVTMDSDVYESGALEVLQGFRIFGNNIINDAVEGKKLQALTQVHKRVEIETERKKGLWK
jgi:hypothetical protein